MIMYSGEPADLRNTVYKSLYKQSKYCAVQICVSVYFNDFRTLWKLELLGYLGRKASEFP